MRVLIIGSGAREHAIADTFARSKYVDRIIVSPGNDGIALEYQITQLPTFLDIASFCSSEHIDLVFIGPEQPLSEGLADVLRQHGILTVGPSQAASRIEASKVFAKNLMKEYEIPTARYYTANSLSEALTYASILQYPLVVKADGLAAGKGVIIVDNEQELQSCLQSILTEHRFGAAGNSIVLEEFLEGWEVSLFVFTDGIHYKTSIFSQDHKQLYDNDKGPNTGGMGAYAPVIEADPYLTEIEESIVRKILTAMREKNSLYQGVLYIGLMITKEGPKVIEFNCRLGDPEAQVILPLLKTDFYLLCQSICSNTISNIELEWYDSYTINVVCAASGYPEEVRRGDKIIINDITEAKIFYSGVKKIGFDLTTNGGRVLSVCATAKTLPLARAKVYTDVEKIIYAGKTFRKDIGLRKNSLK